MEVRWIRFEIEPNVFYTKWFADFECKEDIEYKKEIAQEIRIWLLEQFGGVKVY